MADGGWLTTAERFRRERVRLSEAEIGAPTSVTGRWRSCLRMKPDLTCTGVGCLVKVALQVRAVRGAVSGY